MQCGQGVADGHAHAHRNAPWLGREVAQPAHGFTDHAKAGLVAIGARLAVARDAQDDEARVELVQFLRRHAPAFQRPRPEILDQHVGLGDQAAHQRLTVGLPQVDGH